jgi:hypothetical protein
MQTRAARDLAGVQRPRGGVECPEHIRRGGDRTDRLSQGTRARDRSRACGFYRGEPTVIAGNSCRHYIVQSRRSGTAQCTHNRSRLQSKTSVLYRRRNVGEADR